MMLRALGRFVSKKDVYGSSELAEDCTENLVCCVYEGDSKDARCCNLTTVNEDTPDIFSCGNAYDHDMMTPHELARKKTTNYIRWLLFIAVVVVGLVGGVSLIKPDTVVFNTLVDDVSSARLNEGKELQEEALRREQALQKKLASEDADAQILMAFVNKIFVSKDTTQDEKRVINEMMERAASKIDSAHAERTTIVSPMIIYGALCLFYSIKCAMALLHTVELKEMITHDHILWSLCNAIGYVVATANRGHGMQSSSLTIFLLIYYIANAICWVFIHQRIIYNTYTPRSEVQVQQPSPQQQQQQQKQAAYGLTPIPL